MVNSTSRVRWRRAQPAAPIGDAMLGQHRRRVPAVSPAGAGAAGALAARLRSLRTPPPRRLVTQCSVCIAAASQLSRPLGLERRARRLHASAAFALHPPRRLVLLFWVCAAAASQLPGPFRLKRRSTFLIAEHAAARPVVRHSATCASKRTSDAVQCVARRRPSAALGPCRVTRLSARPPPRCTVASARCEGRDASGWRGAGASALRRALPSA